MSRRKEKVDYQLDLTPFISLLSVCICFLLLTVAWFQVGSLTMKQVLGGDTSEGVGKKKPSLWIHLKKRNHIQVQVKEVKNIQKQLRKKIILSKKTGELSYEPLYKHIKVVKQKIPSISQAFILPQHKTSYEDVIRVMDQLRRVGIFDLGIAPL